MDTFEIKEEVECDPLALPDKVNYGAGISNFKSEVDGNFVEDIPFKKEHEVMLENFVEEDADCDWPAQNCENHSKPECRRRHPISEVPRLKEETDLASDGAFPTSPVPGFKEENRSGAEVHSNAEKVESSSATASKKQCQNKYLPEIGLSDEKRAIFRARIDAIIAKAEEALRGNSSRKYLFISSPDDETPRPSVSNGNEKMALEVPENEQMDSEVNVNEELNLKANVNEETNLEVNVNEETNLEVNVNEETNLEVNVNGQTNLEVNENTSCVPEVAPKVIRRKKKIDAAVVRKEKIPRRKAKMSFVTIPAKQWQDTQNRLKLLHEQVYGPESCKTAYGTVANQETVLQRITADKCALTKENEALKDYIKTMEERVRQLEQTVAEVETSQVQYMDALKTYFSEEQIRKVTTRKQKKRGLCWNNVDIASAISLRCASPRAYRYFLFKRQWSLPDPSTLRRWAFNISFDEGILYNVLSLMEQKGKTMKETERLNAIIFNGMSVSPFYCYDRVKDRVFGETRKVQVVMAKGIFGKWKQPIAYFFDTVITLEIIESILRSLHTIKFPTVALVCDFGVQNRLFMKNLRVSLEFSWFKHPSDPSCNVFCFADAFHLLKQVGNHFVEITTDVIEQILTFFRNEIYKLKEIKEYGRDLENQDKQLKEIIKNINSVQMRRTLENGMNINVRLPFQEGIVRSVTALKKMFLYLKEKYGIGYILTKRINQGTLDNFFAYVRGMGGTHDNPTPIEFQQRLRLYILGRDSSAISTEHRETEDGTTENCLVSPTISFAASTNKQPLAASPQFLSPVPEPSYAPVTPPERPPSRILENTSETDVILRCASATLPATSKEPVPKKNLDTDVVLTLDLENLWTNGQEIKEVDDLGDEAEKFYEQLDELERVTPESAVASESIIYLAGFVAYHFRNKYKNLSKKTRELTEENRSWISRVSKGSLIYPASGFEECARYIEKCFIDYHSEYKIKIGTKSVQSIYEEWRCLLKSKVEKEVLEQIPKEIITYYIHLRTLIQIRRINQETRAKAFAQVIKYKVNNSQNKSTSGNIEEQQRGESINRNSTKSAHSRNARSKKVNNKRSRDQKINTEAVRRSKRKKKDASD